MSRPLHTTCPRFGEGESPSSEGIGTKYHDILGCGFDVDGLCVFRSASMLRILLAPTESKIWDQTHFETRTTPDLFLQFF